MSVAANTWENLNKEPPADVPLGVSAGSQPPQIIPVGALIAANPMLDDPIIDGLLRRGETANVIADTKRGKSWLAYGLALSVATGGDWLARYRCEQGRVLLIDNELRKKTLADRIPKVAAALGMEESDYRKQFDILPLRGQLIDFHGINRILSSVERGTYDMIILDAFYKGLPTGISENDNAQIAGIYNLIDQMAESLDCSWVNVHHSSKGNQSNKSVTDTGAGAGSQSRAADSHIVLRPHQENGITVLDAAVRSFPPVQPIALRWEFPLWLPALEFDPKKLAGLLTPGEKKQNSNDTEGIDAITKALASGDATCREIRRLTGGMGQARCERLLDMLESDEVITGVATIRRGNTCRLYSLVGDVVRDDVPRERTT